MSRPKKPHLVVQRDPCRFLFSITKKEPEPPGKILFASECIVAATEFRLACREAAKKYRKAFSKWERSGNRLSRVKVAPAFKEWFEIESKKHRDAKPVFVAPNPLDRRFRTHQTESAT